MPRALGLNRVPTLDPEGEGEFPSYEYVRNLVRAINGNFEIINSSYQITGTTLDEESTDFSTSTILIGSASNPTYTVNYARYKRTGSMVDLFVNITVTANGGGIFYLVLPVPHRSTGGLFLTLIGHAHSFDASVGTEKLFVPQLQYDNMSRVRWLDVPNCVIMGGTTPWTWANGDAIEFSLRYEAEQ